MVVVSLCETAGMEKQQRRNNLARLAISAWITVPFGLCSPGASNVAGPAGRLHYDAGGPTGSQNEPVVLLHSFAGNTQHWTPTLELLRQNRQAIAIDLRAHGRSEAGGPSGYSIESLADDVAAVTEKIGLKRFVLVGHSMGGLVALEYADRFPERVAGLYLLDSGGAALLYPEPMKADILANVARDSHAESIAAYWKQIQGDATPGLRDRLAKDLARFPRPAILGLMQSMFLYDPRPALGRYRGPLTALVSANNDGPTALHQLRKDLAVERVASTNHWWHLDQPEPFQQHLQSFLAIVDRESHQN